MANPRKFSEKIALQKQKQAEGTAEFEKIMNEVKATRVVDGVLSNADLSDVGNLQRNASLSGGSGGSGTSSGASGGGASPDANSGGGGGIAGGGIGVNSSTGSPAAYRESRGRSVGIGPMRRPSERKQDRSPYGSTASGLMLSGIIPNNSYLSPPMDTSWRRSNSDSALHQTLNIAEGNFSTSPVAGVLDDLNSLHANYHHHQHNQRSHSPNIGRSYSPQAQRRKNALLHQQQQQLQHQMQQQQNHHQQQQQLQHQRLQMQQAQHQHQQQQHLQQHLQNQNQQQTLEQQLHQQEQQYNAKFNNSNIFKSLQEQQLGFNNTGSLPDLTSVHYGTQSNNTQMMQPSSQQQQQQTLSHNNNGCHDRDQSPSPFSPPSTTGGGSGNGGGPPSPYHQQQNSPTSAANTPTAANAQTSPHLSFTNLSVQSPVNVNQTTAQNAAAAFSTLPTLGAPSSTGNLTDYRQPINPPSPGSSPGLLTSGPANDVHISAPPSPIRHCQNNLNSSPAPGNGAAQGGQSQQQQQQMPTQSLQNTFGAIDSNAGYNTLNPAFHNHFEQFNLGDSSQSPQNTYDALEFEDFGVVTSTSNQQQHQQHQHNNFSSKIIDFGDLTSTSSSSNNTRTNNTNTTTNCNNNNNNLPGVQQQQQQQQHRQRSNSQQFQQQHINNNTTTNTSRTNAHTNGPVTSRTHNTAGLMNNNDRHDILSSNSSPIPSPLSHCLPSPSSPLPIPMSGHSPAHQQQQQLSLSVQTSPHHSPMHSPHHSPSPLSVSSPGLTMLGGSISPVPSPSAHIMQQHNHVNNQTATQMHHNQTSQAANQHHHHNQQQQQTHTPCNTTTNIPQIIFSDYSSSRDIFDHLDLDLGQIDEPGLQMLSDQNPIMIADPSIEDSFRRDLN